MLLAALCFAASAGAPTRLELPGADPPVLRWLFGSIVHGKLTGLTWRRLAAPRPAPQSDTVPPALRPSCSPRAAMPPGAAPWPLAMAISSAVTLGSK